jgi:hypothetical protein
MTKRPETGSHKGHNYYSRMIIPNHKSFPNENKQKTKFISLISKYSRTHTITTSVFECDIPLDLWRSLKGCKKDIWRYPWGTISTFGPCWLLSTQQLHSCHHLNNKNSHSNKEQSNAYVNMIETHWLAFSKLLSVPACCCITSLDNMTCDVK